MKYSYTNNRGNIVPKRTKVSPTKEKYNMYNAWQPSLVLGGLGRAQLVPIAC